MNSTPQRQNIGLDRPGVPTLSPDMQRMRLRVLLSVAELPISDAIVEIRKRGQTEPSEMIRIALLAAQSWLVRERMTSMTSGNDLGTVKSVLYPQDAPTPASAPAAAARAASAVFACSSRCASMICFCVCVCGVN